MSSPLQEKPVRWENGEVKSPPFSFEARLEAGGLLGALQQGMTLSSPQSEPLPRIGPRCHTLRIKDEGKKEWRIVYRTDPDAVVVVDVFLKKTRKIPDAVIEVCKQRLRQYDSRDQRGTEDDR